MRVLSFVVRWALAEKNNKEKTNIPINLTLILMFSDMAAIYTIDIILNNVF